MFTEVKNNKHKREILVNETIRKTDKEDRYVTEKILWIDKEIEATSKKNKTILRRVCSSRVSGSTKRMK